MRSKVADTLDAEDRERNLHLSPGERMTLMLEMGERQLQLFMSANELDRDEAIRRLELVRQRGRRPSECMEKVIDASRPDRSSDSR